jgi:hypothetical protein
MVIDTSALLAILKVEPEAPALIALLSQLGPNTPPPETSQPGARCNNVSMDPKSLFTAMRRAWKLRVAGWSRPWRAFGGLDTYFLNPAHSFSLAKGLHGTIHGSTKLLRQNPHMGFEQNCAVITTRHILNL